MIAVEMDSFVADKFLNQFPDRMNDEVNVFIDRVGYKLEGQSKREAPAITGNLRRNIIYNANENINSFATGGAGTLVAHAHYSKYVHGDPFYNNQMRRRETPFITNAISSSESFIKREAEALMRRVLE